MGQELIIHTFENKNCYTVEIDGYEFLTVIIENNEIKGIFKHITAHDRFYCDSFYGDYDTNANLAEKIDRIFMEEAEKEA